MRNFVPFYGIAHLGKSLIWHTSGLLFAYFLTEVCAVPPKAMGYILACDMLFSSGADAGFGRLLRHRVATLAAAGRLQLPGVVISSLMLMGFVATPFIPVSGRIAYAIATCLLFRLAYSFQDVPENAMLYLAEGDARRRVELSSVRFAGSGAASLAIAVAASFLIVGDSSQQAHRFLLFAAAIVIIWLTVSVMLRQASQTRAGPPAVDRTVPKPAKRLPPSRPDLSLTILTQIRLEMLVACGSSVFGILLTYFASLALPGDRARLISLVVIGLGNVATQPLWTWVCRRHGTIVAYRAAAAATALGAAAFFLAARAQDSSVALAGFCLESGLSGLSMLLWAAFADRVSRNEHLSLTRSPTVAMGLFIAGIKLAGAFTLLMIGQLLARIDYHDPTVVTSWRLLTPMAGLPFLSGCLCLLAEVWPARSRKPALP
jgi:Na+/melibiose symporter-like transporter